jgi:hypothetical protein
MRTPPAAASLAAFRQATYDQVLGRRKDTLRDLLDAVLVRPGRASLVQRTLAPVFRRGWASASDALTHGTLDEAACRRLCLAHLPPPAPATRPVWALDGTSWPRPAAVTSPERTWTYRPLPGLPAEGLVAGWEFQWLMAVPEPGSSWVLPLDVARRAPTAGTPTQLALSQLRRSLAALPADAPRPVVTLDSGYEALALAAAVQHPDPAQRLVCDVLVRLNPRRVLWTAPPPYPGAGRPRQYGDKLCLWRPETLPPPDASSTLTDARHGQVTVSVWRQVRQRPRPDLSLSLVRIQVARLPRAGRTPAPLWLAWGGTTEPADPGDYWHWYQQRFTIEQGFRYLKQHLGWTAIRVRAPHAAERWSWLMALALWELWLARTVVGEQRLPWERAAVSRAPTPGQVQRGIGEIVASVGSPARAVRPRGKSPGRAPGTSPGPAPRQPVVRRRPAGAKRRDKPRRRAA